jgi:mannobiose 2-epimerase
MIRRDWMVEFRENLLKMVLGFWVARGIDREHGGAMGWLDRDGNPVPPETKSVAQQGRALWAFAQVFRRYPDPTYEEAAVHIRKFLREKMWDPEFGGYYWLVDREGHVLDFRKLLNPMAYVLEGLAVYALAFHDEQACQDALDLFELIDRHAHDAANGGYHMTFTREWEPARGLRSQLDARSTSSCVSPDQDDHPVLLNAQGRKSSDWHLGLLEAFATLYSVTESDKVRERTEELLDIFVERVIDLERGYGRWYFAEDWTPADEDGDSTRCLYGLDLEMSCLITSTAELLGRQREGKIREAALALIDHALRDGFDHERGGVFNEGPASGPADQRRKEWWQQAEGLVGFLNAYRLTGNPKYYRAFEQQARFVLDDFSDHQCGEWLTAINPDGTIDGAKAGPWRGPYHATRACLEIIRRLGSTL